MTLSRQYNFVPGNVIQSSQVNAEFDQIINTVNSYVLDAEFIANNYVSDGDLVSAINALDANLIKAVPLSVSLNNGIFLKRDNSNKYNILLEASESNKKLFAINNNIFVEDATKTLDIRTIGNNQFIDLYIEHDASDTPAAPNTLPIKISGLAAGSTPMSSSPNDNQHLIGCCYIRDNIIHAIYNMFYPYLGYTQKVYNFNPHNYTISGGSWAFDSSKYIYPIPVFVESDIEIHVEMTLESDLSAKDIINVYYGVYDVGMSTWLSQEHRILQPSHKINTNVWINRVKFTESISRSAGVHGYYLGGFQGDSANSKGMKIATSDIKIVVKPRGILSF